MLYIILPAYNEEQSLPNLMPKLSKLHSDYHGEVEVIVCNDGSSDNTGQILIEYQEKYPYLTVLNHKINRGLGETIRDLIEYACEKATSDDVIARFDCDDSHDPLFIESMVSKLNEGYDVIIASRFQEGGGQSGVNGYRAFISRMANLFMKLWFPIKDVKEYSCGYRVYRASILQKALKAYGNNFIQLKGLGFACTLEKLVKLNLLGAKFAEVPFKLHYDRKLSDSKMVSSITTFGYFALVIMCYWPSGGWRFNRKFKSVSD